METIDALERKLRAASNTSRNASGLLPLKPIVNIFSM